MDQSEKVALIGAGSAMFTRGLAPNALLFNYAKPMAAICRGVWDDSAAPLVGLCHGVISTARYLAKVLNRPLADLKYS